MPCHRKRRQPIRTNHTAEPKPNGPNSLLPLRTHTFVLVLALHPERHAKVFEDLADVLNDLGRGARRDRRLVHRTMVDAQHVFRSSVHS